MGCRTQFCIGGACEPTSTDVSAWVQAFGYVYDANDPLAPYYAQVIATFPAAIRNPVWSALCEACMRTRTPLFCNTSPGDVNGLTKATATNIAGIGSIAYQGVAVGEGIAKAAGAVLGALGPITAGVGAILGPILQIFQQHAKAVAAQANALNTLLPLVTQAIRSTDAYVQSGQATATQGVAMIQAIATQLQQQDSTLTKSCNAFCGYNAIMSAIAQISVYYYQLSAAAQLESVQTTAAASNIAASSTNIIAGQLVAAPPSALAPITNAVATMPTIIWIILGIAVLFFLFRGGA